MTPINEPANHQTDDQMPVRARLDRSTLTGCLGILCVLALPALLFLPVESWHLAPWLLHLIPLIAVGMAALGAWLLVRMPANQATRANDPLHPLTSEGLPPVLERPAQYSNRIGLIACCMLMLISLAGYALVTFGATDTAMLAGTLLASGAGGVLLLYGVVAAGRRLPVPAWRWIRLPIQGGMVFQALPFAFIGLITLVWALFIAASQGYIWAPIGVGALILGCALIGPMTQRLPRRRAGGSATFPREP
jgi:hypothetical protein